MSLIQSDSDMREWLSGGASPCQGEGRGFESRLALQNNKKRISERISFFYYRGTSVPRRFEVYVPLRSAQNRGPPDLVRRLALLNNTKGYPRGYPFCFEKIVLFEKNCYKYDIGCQVMFAIVVKK